MLIKEQDTENNENIQENMEQVQAVMPPLSEEDVDAMYDRDQLNETLIYIKDAALSIRALFPDGKVHEISAEDAGFGYRTSAFEKNGAIILSVKYKLKIDDKNEIEARMNDIMQRRKDKQPLEYPSAGSTFKRPQNGFAAAMIDQCGLKGRSFGGAQVSEKHAGFVINKGGASCSDVLNLMQEIKSEVFSKMGVELHPEVKIIGEE